MLMVCGLLFGVSPTQAGVSNLISTHPALTSAGRTGQASSVWDRSSQANDWGIAQVRVAAVSDAGEEEGPDGTTPGNVYLTSSDLEIVTDAEAPTSGAQLVGMRFNGVNVPTGATIINAYIRFRAVGADAPNTNNNAATLTIRGEAADNPTTFTVTLNNISSRPTTNAAIGWTPPAWEAGMDYATPDIKSVVQEIVDRSGWTSDQSMVFIITGNGSRSADSFSDSTSVAPLLHIEWRIGGVFLPMLSR